MTAKELGGLIFYSPDPERLAQFYKEVIGIPFQVQTHGKIREHFECMHYSVHFAILKRKENASTNNIVPSFRVDDIAQFVDHHKLKMLHPIIELGGGSYVASISDVDGNMIRLWMGKTSP